MLVLDDLSAVVEPLLPTERPKPKGGCPHATQHQWSDPAVFKTIPLLLGLYRLVALYAHQNAERLAFSPRQAAWYPKPAPIFADVPRRLRHHIWFERTVMSAKTADMTEPISPVL